MSAPNGRLILRNGNAPLLQPPVMPWRKSCPVCGHTTTQHTAFQHLRERHGAQFRVDPWMRRAGMPETTFFGLIQHIQEQRNGGNSNGKT